MRCVDAQFAEDVLAMRGDSMDAREPLGSYLLRGLTLSHQTSYIRHLSAIFCMQKYSFISLNIQVLACFFHITYYFLAFYFFISEKNTIFAHENHV
jgi:hypothetical protein